MKKTFSTFDVQKKLGINRNTLQSLLDGNYFNPSIKADGKGSRNAFNIEDLYRLQLLKSLIQAGISRKKASNECDISFQNIGPGSGQDKYGTLDVGSFSSGDLVFDTGGMRLTREYPTSPGTNDVMLTITINLLAIKRFVDVAVTK